VLAIFFSTLLGFTILEPVHLLWINLVTDTFPALALGTEKAERDLMERAPRDPHDGVFAGGVGLDVAYQGTLVTLLTMAAYFIGHYLESGVWEIANSHDGVTMAFLTMCLCQIFHSFNMRSQRHSIFSIRSTNRMLWLASGASFLLTLLVLYVPFLREAFQFAPISPFEFMISLVLAFCMIPIVELVKRLQRISFVKNMTSRRA